MGVLARFIFCCVWQMHDVINWRLVKVIINTMMSLADDTYIYIYITYLHAYVHTLRTLHTYALSFLHAFAHLRRATISFVKSVSVCPSARNNSASTENILTKFGTWVSFGNMSRIFKFAINLTKIKGALHGDQYTFTTISRWIILRMRNVLDESCRENQNTHFAFSNVLLKIVSFMR